MVIGAVTGVGIVADGLAETGAETVARGGSSTPATPVGYRGAKTLSR